MPLLHGLAAYGLAVADGPAAPPTVASRAAREDAQQRTELAVEGLLDWRAEKARRPTNCGTLNKATKKAAAATAEEGLAAILFSVECKAVSIIAAVLFSVLSSITFSGKHVFLMRGSSSWASSWVGRPFEFDMRSIDVSRVAWLQEVGRHDVGEGGILLDGRQVMCRVWTVRAKAATHRGAEAAAVIGPAKWQLEGEANALLTPVAREGRAREGRRVLVSSHRCVELLPLLDPPGERCCCCCSCCCRRFLLRLNRFGSVPRVRGCSGRLVTHATSAERTEQLVCSCG